MYGWLKNHEFNQSHEYQARHIFVDFRAFRGQEKRGELLWILVPFVDKDDSCFFVNFSAFRGQKQRDFRDFLPFPQQISLTLHIIMTDIWQRYSHRLKGKKKTGK